MSASRLSFFILTMYLPGMGEPARGTMTGAGRARTAGRRARRSESFMLAIDQKNDVVGARVEEGC
jgi:hypothetical protein